MTPRSRKVLVAVVSLLLGVLTAVAALRFLYAVVTHGPRDRMRVALTFDACMTERMEESLRGGKVAGWYDDRIVSVLEEKSVPATFFVTGLWASNYPAVVRTLAANPLFRIENHGFSHAAFSYPCYRLPRVKDKSAEVGHAQEILTRLSGRRPVFFRFPGGCCTTRDVAMVRRNDLRAVGWDVNSEDAFSGNEDRIVENVLSRTRGGSIILLHLSGPPNAPATSSALPRIIDGLKERGFDLVPLEDLLTSRSLGRYG